MSSFNHNASTREKSYRKEVMTNKTILNFSNLLRIQRNELKIKTYLHDYFSKSKGNLAISFHKSKLKGELSYFISKVKTQRGF